MGNKREAAGIANDLESTLWRKVYFLFIGGASISYIFVESFEIGTDKSFFKQSMGYMWTSDSICFCLFHNFFCRNRNPNQSKFIQYPYSPFLPFFSEKSKIALNFFITRFNKVSKDMHFFISNIGTYFNPGDNFNAYIFTDIDGFLYSRKIIVVSNTNNIEGFLFCF